MIEAAEFTRRFEALVLGGVGPGLPRRALDRVILLKAACLSLKGDLPCSERHLGNALESWLDMLGPRVDVDSVSLRRALVDSGYLRRDPAGHSYELVEPHAVAFAPDIDLLEPRGIVIGARRRVLKKAEERRRSA